ncbi:MAG: cbb3-type cytochrome oxidase assembly protein CcoS [Planctomycetota bacterium]
MNVLYLVIPLALVIAASAVAGFVWMVRSGQLDDLDSPPLRMLFDDTPVASKNASSKTISSPSKRRDRSSPHGPRDETNARQR